MLRKNILVIFISIIFTSTVYAGSYFAYSTNGKSPGLRALGGSARSVATSFGLIASPDLFSLDIRNFASWSARENTQFTFSFEGTGYSLELDSGEKNDWSQVVFNDIAINIPIFKNKFSFGFGFSPLTNSTIGFSQGDSIGQVIQRFRGNMSDGFANFSFKVSDKFRAGIGILAVFGDLVDEFKVITVDENYISNFAAIHEYKILQPNLVLSGAYTDSILYLSGQAIIPFEGDFVHSETSPGTITRDNHRTLQMPYRFSGGIAWSNGSIKLGLTGLYENWSDGYRINGENFPEDLADYIYVGAGFESTPKISNFSSFSEKIAWRLGAHATILNNKDNFSVINEYGLSTGLGLPFNQYFSNFDVALSGGFRGDISTNLAKEYFVKLTITFTSGERWFLAMDEE